MPNLNFLKKELKEFTKTPKGLILLSLFIFFAIASPILAKYMNEILLAIASDLPIVLPEPQLKDAWLQFYKNMSTIFIVYLIIMTGVISQEKNKGSIILVLTKKVTRFNFMISKFVAGIIAFTVLHLVSILISGWYTNYLFGAFFYEGLPISLFIFWLMGIFFTALGVFMSVIGKTPTSSALLGFFGFAILQILSISSRIALFNPAGASSIVNGILAGSIDLGDLWIQVTSTLSGTIILFILGYFIFRRQEI